MVVSGIAPFIILYNDESRYFGTNSDKRAAVAGESSDVLTTTALPAAIADAYSWSFILIRMLLKID